ncbi:MAG: 30S ribosomal protein S9 [Anaerolineae bacterium]|jgi:small subunit ribosomal protein S9|nr:30S ribosomal protein S9 [Anaerolineae bacterium]
MSVQYFEGIGRRKEATARVRVFGTGNGMFTVNDKPLDQYFTRIGDKEKIFAPLQVAGFEPASMDVTVKVNGGGVNGQMGAVQLGVARALVKLNPELIATLRKGGFLTRDARVKERKKPGLKRARKAPTYTKR